MPTSFALPPIAVFVAALLAAAFSAALLSAGLCVALRPLLLRYALARPNARSSHRVPTPQGGGIAVLAAAFATAWSATVVTALPPDALQALMVVTVAALLLAVIGAWDDIAPLSPGLRLLLQMACVALVIAFAAPGLRLFPGLPPVVERGLAVLAGVWFVNLTNFMDGLDGITIAGFVPLLAALALAGLFGILDPTSAVLAAAVAGGLLGFAPFNRPVARLFLGDVGSLPLGLLGAYLLYRLAGTGGLAAALILPLYHVADSTVTLLRRLARREKVWQAHRSHFYQQATDRGFSVLAVVGHVAALNLALVVLAGISLLSPGLPSQLACLGLAIALTGAVLLRFSRPRR